MEEKEREKEENHLMKIFNSEIKKINKSEQIERENILKYIKKHPQNHIKISGEITFWFKEQYINTNNTKDILKIKDIFCNFTSSKYYCKFSKADRRKYSKSYFIEYFETNIFFRKHYVARDNNIRNVMKGWKLKDIDVE